MRDSRAHRPLEISRTAIDRQQAEWEARHSNDRIELRDDGSMVWVGKSLRFSDIVGPEKYHAHLQALGYETVVEPTLTERIGEKLDKIRAGAHLLLERMRN